LEHAVRLADLALGLDRDEQSALKSINSCV
jgi:hypothetical protein